VNLVKRYTAAGGIVVDEDQVLVLRRPSRDEVRLPKGHIEPGETIQEAALRETAEESGYRDLNIKADLGSQVVTFHHQGQYVIRRERYFLMSLLCQSREPSASGESQFESEWLTWEEALGALTFEAEQEWVRRARRLVVMTGAINDGP